MPQMRMLKRTVFDFGLGMGKNPGGVSFCQAWWVESEKPNKNFFPVKYDHTRSLQSSKNANFQNGSTFCRKAVAQNIFRHTLAYVKSFKLRIKHHGPHCMLCPGGSFLSLRRSIFLWHGSRFFLVSTIRFLVKFHTKKVMVEGLRDP